MDQRRHHHRVAESKCTNCGKRMTAASTPDDRPTRAPSPGDVAVCLYCHHLMIYDADMSLRDPTSDELAEVAGDPEILEAMEFAAEYEFRKRTESGTV